MNTGKTHTVAKYKNTPLHTTSVSNDFASLF